MEWYVIVILVLAAPFLLLPVAFIWYLNVVGMAAVTKESREEKAATQRAEEILEAGDFQQVMHVVDRVDDVMSQINAVESAVTETGKETAEASGLERALRLLAQSYEIVGRAHAVESAVEEMGQATSHAGQADPQREEQPGVARA